MVEVKMFNNSTTANSLLTEHEGIRASILQLSDLVNQQFETAERTMTNNLSPEQLQNLEGKRFNIEQNIVSLEEALKNHYANEKEFLRPLLGNLLKKAITKGVIDILRQFAQAKSAIINTNFKESNREQALVKIVNIKKSIESLSQQVETHVTKMDGVLKLLEGILGPEKQQSS